MDKKVFRSLLLLISFTILLIVMVVKIDALLWILGYVIGVLQPIFIGIAIAFVLSRPCAWFHKLLGKLLQGEKGERLVNPLSVVCSYLLLFGLIAALFAFVLPQLVASIELFAANLDGYIIQLQKWVDWFVLQFNMERLDLSQIDDAVKNIISGTLNALSGTLPHLMNFTSNLVSVIVTLALSLVFSIYLLAERTTLLRQARQLLKAYLPPKVYQTTLEVAQLSGDTFGKFISGQLIEACILGILCFIGMSLFGFHYAPLISVIIAVSALIPIVGAYVGAILSALLLLLISPTQAFWFLIFLTVLQQIEGNVIYPRVVGGTVGLPGLWVLASVVIGGEIFGLLGVLLAVPVASILYTLLKKDVYKRLDELE